MGSKCKRLRAAWKKAGLPDWDQMEAGYDHLLALSHGRLARAYFMTRRRKECLNELALAVKLGTRAVEIWKRDVNLEVLAQKSGMDSPEKVFAVVHEFDEGDRENVQPAKRDDLGKPATGTQYTPGMANCLLESDAKVSP